MRNKARLWVPFVVLVLGLGLLVGMVLLFSMEQNKHFVTTFYTVSSDKLESKLRIVDLADLHLSEFGENNAELVARVRALQPDLIALPGDMTLRGEPYDVVITLLEQLVEIAPVYYCAGNHELVDIFREPPTTLIADIEATGAVFLDNAYRKLTINGMEIAIGGFCKTNAFQYSVTPRMLDALHQETCFKLLMSHYPEALMDDALADYSFDLVLCGHTHGGQIRLPLTEGLYTREQGFLPKYTNGIHTMSGSTVIISRGLGDSTSPLPRINNQPELVVIDVE